MRTKDSAESVIAPWTALWLVAWLTRTKGSEESVIVPWVAEDVLWLKMIVYISCCVSMCHNCHKNLKSQFATSPTPPWRNLQIFSCSVCAELWTTDCGTLQSTGFYSGLLSVITTKLFFQPKFGTRPLPSRQNVPGWRSRDMFWYNEELKTFSFCLGIRL